MTRYKYSVRCVDMDPNEWPSTEFDDLNNAGKMVEALDSCTQVGLKFGTPLHEHAIVWIRLPEE